MKWVVKVALLQHAIASSARWLSSQCLRIPAKQHRKSMGKRLDSRCFVGVLECLRGLVALGAFNLRRHTVV